MTISLPFVFVRSLLLPGSVLRCTPWFYVVMIALLGTSVEAGEDRGLLTFIDRTY